VNEQRLRDAMRSVDEAPGARARALDVVRAAYREREPVPPPPRRWVPVAALLVCVLAAAVVAVTVGSPGDAVARWVRQVLGTGHPAARPALVRVPGGGRLLVSTADGAWVVAADGSRRRLGDYAGASWSAEGRFVVAWRGGELVAMEPSGRVRWSLAREGRITVARWARVEGFRVAYLSGRTLRVVDGDGTDDRRLGPARAVAPAWRPDTRYVLAYADRRGRVRVVPVDGGRELWRTPRIPGVQEIAWAPDGRRLVVTTPRRALVYARGGRLLAARTMPRAVVLDHVSWSPDGRLAEVRRGARTSAIVVGARTLFTGTGRFGSVAFSPSGRRLLVPWPVADQWLFLGADGGRAAAVANIERQFGGPGPVEWCCS
jgi:hypothetical protein